MANWFTRIFKSDSALDLNTNEAMEKASGRPWVKIVGEEIDPEEGIKIELDWNEPFIEYLRSNGINGADDEQIVQKWIAMLYRDLTTQMSEGSNEFE